MANALGQLVVFCLCHLFFLSGFVRESLTRWFSGRIPTEQTTV
jgi:hypothetical protein